MKQRDFAILLTVTISLLIVGTVAAKYSRTHNAWFIERDKENTAYQAYLEEQHHAGNFNPLPLDSWRESTYNKKT